MASENKNENVLLTGQSGYFKKNGSMTNYGTINLITQDSSSSYGPGFIDEGSTIKGAILEDSSDYKNTESAMRTFLGDDFIEDTEGYKVKVNADRLANDLAPYYTKLQRYVDSMEMYKVLPFLTTIDNGPFTTNAVITLPKNFDIQIDIEPDHTTNTEYDIFCSENNELRFWKDSHNRLCFNNTVLDIDGELDEEDTIVVDKENGAVSVFVNGNKVHERDIETEIDTEMTVTLFKNFIGKVYSVKVYNDDTEEEIYNLKPFVKKGVGGGLLDVLSNTFYELTQGTAKLYTPYYRAYFTTNVNIDLGVLVDANTGVEIDFMSNSTVNQLRIFGVESDYSVANTVTFSLYRNGSGYWAYARNNNVGNWISTGISADTSKTIISINKQNDGKIKINGGALYEANLSGTVTNKNTNKCTLWLHGTNDIGAYRPVDDITAYYATGSYPLYVYSMKVWDGDTLIRDLVPAKDIQTNRNCMYDKVENKAYFPGKGNISVYN